MKKSLSILLVLVLVLTSCVVSASAEAARTLGKKKNMFTNGHAWVNNGAMVAEEISNGVRLTISDSVIGEYTMGYSSNEMKLEWGKTYTVSYKLKSSQPIIIRATVAHCIEPWTTYSSETYILNPGREYAYSYDVTMPNDEDRGELAFCIFQGDGVEAYPLHINLEITDISIIKR